MKRKKILSSVLIFFMTGVSVLTAGMQYNEYMYIPWGDTENSLKHKAYPGLHNGPHAFQVRGGNVIILDNENRKLKTFDENGLIGSQEIPFPYVVDFYREDNLLFLSQPQRIYRYNGRDHQLVAEEEDPRKMFRGFYEHNGSLCVDHSDGAQILNTDSFRKQSRPRVEVKRQLPDIVMITVGGKSLTLRVEEVGSVDYIGSTPDGGHYIYAESITRHVPLAVDRFVYLMDMNGDIRGKITLPPQKYTYSFREFDLDAQGRLYHMHSAKDGIHIIRWEYDADLSGNVAEYPATFQEVYHFNDFIESGPETSQPLLSKTANSPVTRTEALETGDEYVQHVWTATSDNIGTTSTITTPEWIQVGENQRIPYKWGGWSTVAQFDDGIAAGKYAGDINTSTVDWGNSVGADCSGFVSVCWNTSQKYGTSTIHNCSSQLSSFNDLLPADATNNAGSHIRMVVEWTTDGKLVQIEETSSGNPGWAARYYTWLLSDITNYVPIRYDLIQESLAPRPVLLSALTVSDSVQLSWEADESVDFTGYRIYGRTPDNEEFVLDTAVNKGILSIKLACDADTHYEYKIAAYNEGAGETASDIYTVKRRVSGKEILIVDGFDRFGGSGSWSSPVHDFAARSGEALDIRDIAYESCANEAITEGLTDLKDYEMVWWILGDESTVDETFNSVEQDSVESYLDAGGKFFVSGSEISWDLDNKGSSADKAFIHNYLKAAYAADDAGNYTVNGASGSIFEGLGLQYSDDGSEPGTFEEDYPDVLSTKNGSAIALKYGNSQTAAVTFDGNAPGGSVPCKLMVMGFPFETITTASLKKNSQDLYCVLWVMRYELSTEEELPHAFELYHNYPNPFNPRTTIAYRLEHPAYVEMEIFDLQGRSVYRISGREQAAGRHEIVFDGTNLPSGMYVYCLRLNGETAGMRKMTLVK
ncbi:MAG: T9SS type A sorting domain-containing protein [Candidatus Marinimicrobia bacterium]|nr:T9SS type A sorting domain-containing protein [Candidatus Neomarinimicrobiota bacterium]